MCSVHSVTQFSTKTGVKLRIETEIKISSTHNSTYLLSQKLFSGKAKLNSTWKMYLKKLLILIKEILHEA